MFLELLTMVPIHLQFIWWTVGPKNTDHTISYIIHFLSTLPSWIKRIHLFLDNASSTNKNLYTMGWALEMVQQRRLDFIRVSFFIAGHTKFTPDLLFSKVAKTYNSSDVFTAKELSSIASQYATVSIDEGAIVTGELH